MANDTYNTLANQYRNNSYYGNTIKRYNTAGVTTALGQTVGSAQAELQAKANLIDMLKNQGRMDPRILARQQALNSRFTQQQQNQAAGANAARGFGGGGLNQALQASIAQAGQNRDQNLRYQDIQDSMDRNQKLIGLTNDTVTRPGIDFAAIGAGQYGTDRQFKNQQNAGYAAILSQLAGYFTGGGGGE